MNLGAWATGLLGLLTLAVVAVGALWAIYAVARALVDEGLDAARDRLGAARHRRAGKRQATGFHLANADRTRLTGGLLTVDSAGVALWWL